MRLISGQHTVTRILVRGLQASVDGPHVQNEIIHVLTRWYQWIWDVIGVTRVWKN